MTEINQIIDRADEADYADDELELEPFQTGKVVLLSGGHAVHDTYTAFLAPLLPVLIEKFSLLKTEAGLLSLFMQSPSILQPVIGHMADSLSMRYFVILAPAITGTMMSLLGIAPSYLVLAIFLLIAGFSSAGLHAVGPVMAGRVSGSSLGRGMGFWMVGGELGRTVGPILLVTAIGYLSLGGLTWLMIGGWVVSGFLFLRLRAIPGHDPGAAEALPWRAALSAMRPLMLPLSGVLTARAFMSASITTYLPMFLIDEGVGLWLSGAALTVLEAAGVVGAIVGGSISDKIGRKVVLLISMVGTPIFAFAFLRTSGLVQALLLPALGFFALSTTPVIMAWVQESYMENRALANGVYMAMGFLIRAVVVVILGRVGDLVGLRQGFQYSAIIMLLGIPLVFFLPHQNKRT
ncbi:MAG: MFS transporter [Anaerolineales bacterium]|nr:MFS transporter [Anaerolineales bacterium]